MKEIFKKYYEMNSEEKDEIEDIYILHNLKKLLKKNVELELNGQEEEILFETVKDCINYTNKSCKEIILALLNILKKNDINIFRLEDLGINDLKEILKNSNKQKKITNLGLEMITAFRIDDYYCVLFKKDKGYTLIYENDDCIQYQDDFKNLKEFIGCFVKYRLEERVKKVVQ